jgi:hypothetical protein
MRYLICSLAVLLTATSLSFGATKTWTGLGADTNWATAANWANNVGPVAGDDLVFPAAAAQQTNNNNTLLLTTYRSITIEGGAYTMGGNPIRLSTGLTAAAGTHSLNFALTLSAPQTFSAGTGAAVTIVILSVGSNALTIDGAGTVGIGLISGSGGVVKNGQGIGGIFAASGYSGPMTLNDGIFVVDANIPNSAITVQGAPATPTNLTLSGFGGTGTVGAVNVVSGVVSSGTLSSPTGILNINNGLTLTANGAFGCKIAGPAPGANGYDQLNVTGTVNLGNALFVPLPISTYRPSIGDALTIIRNDGTDAVVGTFFGLPEGAMFAGPLNTAYRITYHGGDGNDVVLTRVARTAFDLDGDGKADAAIYRPSQGYWWQLNSSNQSVLVTAFGLASDVIVPADYDGDNKTDISVFRPSTGNWYSMPISRCRRITTATDVLTSPCSDPRPGRGTS